MARPMVLIKEHLLMAMYDKYKQGVPVLKLIAQHNLADKITAPTLTKLLNYVRTYEDMDNPALQSISSSTEHVKAIIHGSLFPLWVKNAKEDISLTPATFFYTGKMPLGHWIVREGK